jgi:hypothetical protein
MDDERDKGEWAQTAEEGIVPDELGADDSDAAVLGETTGSDEPATEAGIDTSAGDNADAVTDGGPQTPEGEEPDLRDAASGPRQVDR